jgi:hypothetical protein
VLIHSVALPEQLRATGLGDSQQVPFALCGEDPSASDNLPPSRHRPMLYPIACDFPCVVGVLG